MRRFRMSSEPSDYRLLIVEPLSPAPALNVPRRKRTPKLEAQMPHHVAIICHTSVMPEKLSGKISASDYDCLESERELFPLDEAHIDEVTGVAYTTTSRSNPINVFSTHPVRHIILPFNLREDAASFDKEINRILIEQLLPNIVSVRFGGLSLIICVSKMPSHFLPETIAGVPVYFTEDADDSGPIPVSYLLETQDGTQSVNLEGSANENALDAAAKYFAENGIPVREFHLWKDWATVVLEHDRVDRQWLPQTIARRSVFYIFKEDARCIETISLRDQSDEWRASVDYTTYDNLQPGVMLSSGRNPIEVGNENDYETSRTEMLSSSGIMVTDKKSNRFMTVSSSHFPYGVKVFHPTMASEYWRCLGEIVCELPHLDISLVRLERNEVLNNQPFQNTLIEQMGIGSLKDFLNAEEIDMGTPVYINSPATGYKRGTLGPCARIQLDSNNSGSNKRIVRWIRARMIYIGRLQLGGTSNIGGLAGTPVWSKLGHVLGVIRGNKDADVVLKHWTYMIPAEYFTELGYSVTIEGATNPEGVGRSSSPEAMLY
ncbi:hypothetical protein KEM54_004530 [Ascosphaera aggregata]|nr:hypothetical protein KEM54_004530 [Ascosphaera aggregata]